MSNLNLSIRFDRLSKIYYAGEKVKGSVCISCKNEIKHDGATIGIEGVVSIQLSSKSVGIFESFYHSVKPINLINHSYDICKPGKFPPGKTEIPFEFPLSSRFHKKLFETYHGVFINVQYNIKFELHRSFLNKDVAKTQEFFLELKPGDGEVASIKPLEFCVTPNTLQNVKDRIFVPAFKVYGKVDSTICCIRKPFTGEIFVEFCDAKIESIELQLIRVETCGGAEGFSKDSTEVQNIEIGSGDVMRKVRIPIYMLFPRLFTCPTLVTDTMKIEFEVNIVLVFGDFQLIIETIPIKITRF